MGLGCMNAFVVCVNLFWLQKDNVANQRENLILLLANVHIRQKPKPDPENKVFVKQIHTSTLKSC
jgi:hypothetical protein